jgi:hypothetical protein
MALQFLRNALNVSLLAAGSLLCMVMSVQAASPGLPDYPWDLRKRMPVYYQAYMKILPAQLKRTAWFGRFDGTGMPVERVTVDLRCISRVGFVSRINAPTITSPSWSRLTDREPLRW